MSEARRRSPGYASLVIGCAAVTGALSIGLWAFPSEVKAIIAEARLLTDEGWIMSGTGDPTPDSGFLNSVESLYLSQDSGFTFDPLTTPEQFCPIVCNPSEPDLGFGDSLNAGASDLNSVIVPALQGGNDVAVLGYSQSADVATIEMNDLLNNTPAGVNLHDSSVTLLGDPQSPIGGILDRFQFPDGVGAFSLSPEPQHVPFLDIPLSLATTPTTGIATDIYTGEYDGWADFPQDPTNILGDINALIGIDTVHPFYPDLTSAQLASAIDVGTIGDTNFYDIPENLPILAWMFDGGPAGQFFGDAFSPFLRLIIDWGYGNAGDPAVDGFYTVPQGPGGPVGGPDGSPYEAAQGVAGGPWAETPLGTLYDGSGVAGLFDKMDPLQLLAGFENAGIQTFVGPFTDILADINGGTLSPGDITTMDDATIFLQNITGYDLVNLVDKSLQDSVTLLGPGAVDALDQVLDGPLIPGQPLIDLVGYGFDIFNFFGA
ncbi:MAG: PE-PPE domain-containing protein [Mycobacterium sp.]|nr:PE-PPE domain-containing protein [Mycobacterium sp.]